MIITSTYEYVLDRDNSGSMLCTSNYFLDTVHYFILSTLLYCYQLQYQAYANYFILSSTPIPGIPKLFTAEHTRAYSGVCKVSILNLRRKCEYKGNKHQELDSLALGSGPTLSVVVYGSGV